MATRRDFASDEEYQGYLKGYEKGAYAERQYGPNARPHYTARSWGLFKVLMCLCVMAFVAIFALQSWPTIQPYIAGLHLPAATQAPIIVVATSGTAPRPTTYTSRTDPRTNPTNQATAEAQSLADYATAVARAAATPVPNVDTTGDSAALQRVSIESDRQPAPAYAPTAEPIPQTDVDGAFGSKPAPPVNIQETHECKHGQVWTDSGCKNPTPVQ